MSGIDDWVVPQETAPAAPSRFAVNAAEGFRGTLLGEAVERTRSGQVAGYAADAAARAVAEARAAGSPYGLERIGDTPSPYAGIPVDRLEQLGAQAAENAQTRGQTYREQTLPARAAEEAALPPISGPIEALTALAGQLVGGMGSPESFVGPAGANLARQGGETIARFAGRQAVESGVPNAVVGAVADPVVQSGQVARGEREAYSPIETAFAAAVGGIIGTGLPVGVDAVRAARGLIASRRGVPPEAVTPEEVAAAWSDPDIQRAAQANGITDPADPRVAQLQPRVEARRAAETDPLEAARQRVARGGRPGR